MESFWDKNETSWRVLCIDCIAETAGDTKEQAIAAWNRRSDAVPVVRGEWIEHEDEMECPQCCYFWNYCDNDTERFNYCPNCGAKMEDKP
jgi:hypothetical protein